MKIHFDNENENANVEFADDFEKEWASKNPEVFEKTISDIKEMYLANAALQTTKSNNEKEMRISDNEKALAISKNVTDTMNNCVSVLSNYFTNVNFDEVPNIPVN